VQLGVESGSVDDLLAAAVLGLEEHSAVFLGLGARRGWCDADGVAEEVANVRAELEEGFVGRILCLLEFLKALGRVRPEERDNALCFLDDIGGERFGAVGVWGHILLLCVFVGGSVSCCRRSCIAGLHGEIACMADEVRDAGGGFLVLLACCRCVVVLLALEVWCQKLSGTIWNKGDSPASLLSARSLLAVLPTGWPIWPCRLPEPLS